MQRGTTSRIGPSLMVASLVVAGLLLLTACAGGSDTGEPGSSGSAASSAGGTTKSSPTTKPVDLNVTVKDGAVSPKPARVKVPLGSPVRLMVTSDVDDEVHVHGYDIEREVAAGQTATIEFTADQSGVFEVETHESDLLLLQLQVQ